MSSDALPETYALARRGLPLAAPTRATLRGAWLPPAARSWAVAAPAVAPGTAAASPPVPQALDEEPWWVEASEWVPADEAQAAAARMGTRAPSAAVIAVDEPAAGGPSADRAGPAWRAAPAAAPATGSGYTPGRSTGRGLGAIGAREAAGETPPRIAAEARSARATAPDTPAAPSSREALRPAAPDRMAGEPPSQQYADAAAATREAAFTPADPDLAASAAAAASADEVGAGAGHVSRDLAAPAQPDPMLRATASSPSSRTPVAAGGPAPVARREGGAPAAPVPAAATATGAGAAAQPQAAAGMQAMGAPHSAARSGSPAPLVDMAALLAPAPRRAAQVHIGRITVAVQAAPAVPPQPGIPATAAPARTTAPPAPAFRNPWSGYHARRD